MSPEKKTEIKNLEADVVVIGGGGAGLAAAVSAAEQGAKNVIVLEKRLAVGGNSARAGGIFACESPIQRREKLIADKDDYFKRFMKWALWGRVNPRVVRAYINKSGDTIRWLQEKGIDFMLISLFPNQVAVGHVPNRGGGAQLIKVLEQCCKDKGVQVFLRTPAKKLIRGAKGNITGVVAVNEKGEEFNIKTKSVIIASGGFAGNKELLKKYCHLYYDGMRLGGHAHTGDGLLMAEEAGAAIADTIPMLREGPAPDTNEITPLYIESIKEPCSIWVNKLGRRFVDETAGFLSSNGANAVIKQPDHLCYAFFDSSIRQYMERSSYTIDVDIKDREKAKTSGTPELQEALEKQTKPGGMVKISDSLDEIAKFIGAEPAVLKATIDEYNSFCEKGHDDDFAKDRRYLRPLVKAPYYAIRGVSTYLDTLGGIIINEKMEVLDKQSKVIPGLYTAGVAADGFEANTYCNECTGSEFGFAVNSGRIAGENATIYALGK